MAHENTDPVAPRATEILRELDSYRAAIRDAFEEAFALSKLEGSVSAAIVRELLAAAPVPCAASPEDPWQPIETAPKNTPLLVALIQDGKVMRVSDAKRNDIGFYSINGGVACHWRTHWMLMPRATGEGTRIETAAKTADGRASDARSTARDGETERSHSPSACRQETS